MKTKFILFNLLLLIWCISFAQTPPQIEWEKSFGGNDYDAAHFVQSTSDGGYVIAGVSGSNNGNVTGNHGNYDFWVTKLSSTGTLQWQKSLGGSLSDVAYSIKQTSDGGYIATGYTASNDGDVSGNHGTQDIWVVKLDNLGVLQWQKTFGGSADDYGHSISQTSDGGYILAGIVLSNDGNIIGNHGSSDVWLAKLSNTGILQWQKTLGGSDGDGAYNLQITSDGGYILAGYSQSSNGDVTTNQGTFDYWVLKLNNTGTLQWQKTFGGSGEDIAREIQQTGDGGYIITGSSASSNGDITGNHGFEDFWVIKLNANGVLQWQKTLGSSDVDYGLSIKQTSDGGYITVGSVSANDGNVTGNHGTDDFWAVKLDANGALKWQKAMGSTGYDGAANVLQTSDGGCIVVGSSDTNDGDVTVNNGVDDFWIVKLAANPNGITENNFEKYFQLAPNPSNGKFYLTNSENLANNETMLAVSNVLGQIILKMKINSNKTLIDLSNEKTGLYFLSVQQENGNLFTTILSKQ